MSGHAVLVLGLGLIFLIGGALMLLFKTQLDTFNMRRTPKWMKPKDGLGVYAPDQKAFRVRGMAIAGTVFTIMGIAGVILALLDRHLN